MRKTGFLALLTLVALFLGACSSIDGSKIKEYESLPELQDQSYDTSILRIGDHLTIFVSGDRKSSQDVVVSDDGRIELEYVGTIVAVGKTREIVRREIAQSLGQKQIYTNPQVVINIAQRDNPPQIAVMGDVNNPRVVRFRQDMNVSVAIAEAGGLKEAVGFARPIIIVRNALTNPLVFKFDIEEAISGAKPWPRLVPGDVVVAQSSAYIDVERALGTARSVASSVSAPLTVANAD